jgi:hypothetical protein
MREPTAIVDALQDATRLEGAPDPCAMVIFGASGDLTR